jgi:hypothetical protein
MNRFAEIMFRWEQTLNADEELQERNRNSYSTIEGRTAIELIVGSQPPYKVEVKDGKFKVSIGAAEKPLLRWKMPGKIFSEVIQQKHQLLYSMLDPEAELTFDTPHFTHWNGATIIEMLLLASEMTIKHPDIQEIVQKMEC